MLANVQQGRRAVVLQSEFIAEVISLLRYDRELSIADAKEGEEAHPNEGPVARMVDPIVESKIVLRYLSLELVRQLLPEMEGRQT
jgi:hypothetical protein